MRVIISLFEEINKMRHVSKLESIQRDKAINDNFEAAAHVNNIKFFHFKMGYNRIKSLSRYFVIYLMLILKLF